ncbi:MAG TPA: carboxypeptidase regulatory-like domain-containing protein [Gemmatimonadaceae bacterium]|nr:carboxypeptidase regulatory-like domain-containing protein [Gemmatimonadaceae bacterium]
MHTLRPPAGAALAHYSRLIGGALALALTCAGDTLGAQTFTTNLRGYVRSSAGVPVADAQVVARDVETNQRRGTTTNATGYYYIGGLRPGQYEVSLRRLGVAAQSRPIRLAIGQTHDLDFTAGEANVQLAAVVVTAAGDAESRTSEIGTNVSREQIENLPSPERNFLDIARLAPGMTATAVNDRNKVIASGGQPAEAVNVFVDGVSYKNDVLKGGVVGQDASKGNPFPQGAVQEFRVITQNYKAEYQKAASAVISATTRSGSNVWEGEGFVSGIAKNYVARDAFTRLNAGARSEYTRLQLGGSVGGPIQRDKLFFFGTYELNSRDEPQVVSVGSSAALAPAGLNPQQYAGSFVSQFREHLAFAKLSWVPTSRSTIDVSGTLRHETDLRGFGTQTSYEAAENVKVNVLSGGANWKFAGDRWLNEAQFSAQHFGWQPTPVNPGLVAKDYAGIIRIGGKEGRQDWAQGRVSFRDDVTRSGVQLMGDHAFKAGASLDFLDYEATKDFFFSTPLFRFRSDEGYARPFNATFGFGDPKVSTTNKQFGVYLQDDWNVTRKLVLNLGIRWDGETNMINNGYVTPQPLADSLRLYESRLVVERPQASGPAAVVPIMQQLGGLDRYITTGNGDRPMYKKAFQPRLGASYDLFGDQRTVLFGGFGIYFDRNYWNTLFDERFRRQYRQLDINFKAACAPGEFACAAWDPRFYDPAQLRTLGYATAPEVFLVANDMRPPKTNQFSAGVRQSVGGTRVTLSYNGIRGFNGMNYVRVSPWGGPETTAQRNYATIFAADDRVRTWYDALQLQLDRPLMPGGRWGGGLAYTLSRSEEQGQSTDIFWGFDDRFPTVGDRPRLRAPGDQRHAIVANGIVQLPLDIRLSSIVSLGSGIAVNATNASGGWGPYEQRTYLFQPPTRAFLGLGHVFAYQNADLRLEKGVNVARGQMASLTLDLFNAFNSTNWGCYDTTIIPTANQATDTGWQKNFGQPKCAGLGRRLQLGLRYGYRGASDAASGNTVR